jgi:hypothetical protein
MTGGGKQDLPVGKAKRLGHFFPFSKEEKK